MFEIAGVGCISLVFTFISTEVFTKKVQLKHMETILNKLFCNSLNLFQATGDPFEDGSKVSELHSNHNFHTALNLTRFCQVHTRN